MSICIQVLSLRSRQDYWSTLGRHVILFVKPERIINVPPLEPLTQRWSSDQLDSVVGVKLLRYCGNAVTAAALPAQQKSSLRQEFQQQAEIDGDLQQPESALYSPHSLACDEQIWGYGSTLAIVSVSSTLKQCYSAPTQYSSCQV